MNCCEKCFKSSEIIKSMIKSINKLGNCNFCGSTNVHIYNLGNNQGLDDYFNNVLSIFKLSKDLIDEGYPTDRLISIKDEFEKNWNIFNKFDSNKIYRFLHSLLECNYSDKIHFLNSLVGVIEWINEDYLEENSVLKGYTWDEFVKYIKHENRFHTNHVNYVVLKDYVGDLTTILEDDTFYRGRISNDRELEIGDMGAPDSSFATSGRANSEGISHLYLASDVETVISEIRPSLGDVVFIGKFPIRQELKVVDFRRLNSLDVFEFSDPVKYAINLEILNEMSKAISKPVRSGDSKLDYLPTQFIVDFIKSLNETEYTGYHGIVYESTVSNGYNLMVFDPALLNCIKVEKRIIQTLNYTYLNN